MKWEFSFINDNILVSKCAGEFSLDDLQTMAEELVSDSRWKPEKNLIIDFREVIIDKIALDDIYSSLDVHRHFNDSVSGKIAVINKDHIGHGISSLYEIISRQYIKSKYGSFINFDDALKWIREN